MIGACLNELDGPDGFDGCMALDAVRVGTLPVDDEDDHLYLLCPPSWIPPPSRISLVDIRSADRLCAFAHLSLSRTGASGWHRHYL
jgi:hypothetical protein